MRFRDIFYKYINGNANDDEVKIIENEIEKNELINNYLADKIEDDLIKKSIKNNINNEIDKNRDNNKIKEEEVILEVKKAINKKLLKVGLISASLVICLLISLKIIVSPIMNKIYYNPLENVGENIKRMELDLEIFSELHFPGVTYFFDEYEALGFGKYDISLREQNYFQYKNNVYNGKVDKNKFEISNEFYKYPYKSAFSRDMVPFYQYPTDNDDNQIKELKELPEYIKVKANISFAKDLNMDEVLKLIRNTDIDTYWVAIRSIGEEEQRFPHLGMVPSGSGIVLGQDDMYNDKYPYLELGWIKEKDLNGRILEEHYKSLLSYMSDNKQFDKINLLYDRKSEYYKEALDYVSNNGIMSYGIVVSGTPKQILELRENTLVECINVSDLKLSTLSLYN